MLEAAVVLLCDGGLSAATLAAIGERAGYSRGLVTHRFGTKAGLLGHLHDQVVADWIARVQQAVGDSVGVVALLRVIDALHGFIEEAPDEMRVMYQLRYASIDPGAEFRANVANAHKAQRRDVQRWIERGQQVGAIDETHDAVLAAELFCATVDGLIYRWLVNPGLPVRELHALLKRQTLDLFSRSSPAC
ncbi:TetR/AcrR family transcriptional regulator [Solimonas sp. C16B3]|uniref:TetR/AcrR family transcriptional regulator n=1 Tax=Solimonas marina TaxID=2714601 RepID=A0A969WDA1_9GAMM|nr:TetR/AcrR family transcriptional regulator [Solimonas marina]